MFVRADRLLGGMLSEERHIIGFGWRGFIPRILVYDPGSESVDNLEIERLDLTLSSVKTCVGRFDEDGYHPCLGGTRVMSYNQCRECASVWIPVQECIFEPQCRGERCECDFCSREHLVYASFMGKTSKIGMTSSARLEERGIEQGADAIVPLVRCGSRMEARNMENTISRRLGISQRVTQKAALESMAMPFDRDRAIREYEEMLDRLSPLCDPPRSQIIFLDGYPLALLEAAPVPTSSEGHHGGDLLGFRGRFAVYAEKGSLKALNLSDAVARRIIAAETQGR